MSSEPARTSKENTPQTSRPKRDAAPNTKDRHLGPLDTRRRSERLRRRQQSPVGTRLSRTAPQASRKRKADIDVEDSHQRAKQARQTISGLHPAPKHPATSDTQPLGEFLDEKGSKRRRTIASLEHDPDEAARKRQRTSPVIAPDALGKEDEGETQNDWRAILRFWVTEGRWPEEYFQAGPGMDPSMEHLLARKKSSRSSSRTRSSSASSQTPSDQKPREEKSAPYRDPRYETLLNTKGVFLDTCDLDIAVESKNIPETLLQGNQTVPESTIFGEHQFEYACRNLQGRNEARIIQDISRLLVPSAETFAMLGSKHLEKVIESVNEGWNNCIPLTGTRPQPDYSVGFRREAFSNEQLDKLSPFIGNWLSGDLSFFMATYYMYFPFLSCEVKCGAAALDVADRQNAHSMAVAVRAIVELFRLVKREGELQRQILSFSVSHDHRMVRIYGYYPVIDGKDTKYYRHPIYTFDFTTLNGKEKWTAYHFTKNVYDNWMPSHFKKICSAVDQLPSHLDFGVDPLAETGLSQELESLSTAASSDIPLNPAEQQVATPDSSLCGVGAAKRPKKDVCGIASDCSRSVTVNHCASCLNQINAHPASFNIFASRPLR